MALHLHLIVIELVLTSYEFEIYIQEYYCLNISSIDQYTYTGYFQYTWQYFKYEFVCIDEFRILHTWTMMLLFSI